MNNNHEDTENKIIGNLLRRPWDSKSFLQISKETNLSYVTVFKIIPKLEKNKILKIERKGKSNLVSVNFDNITSQKLSSAIFIQISKIFKKYPSINLVVKDIAEALSESFYILILFGSYAKGSPEKNSDMDFLIIIPNKENSDDYLENLKKVSRLHNKLSFKIVKIKEFSEMLNEKNTLGREAFLYGIPLFGSEQYYQLVKNYVGKKGY